MLSKALLATLLACAPSGLWAFEDMDCIGTEYCTDAGCTPSAHLYSVAFDWRAEAVDIARDGQPPVRLTLVYATAPTSADTGNLGFAEPDGDHAIILEAHGDRIEASLSVTGGLYLGQCTAREAA